MVGNQVYMKISTMCLLATAIGCLMEVSTPWAQECTPEAWNKRFPRAVLAIHQWSEQYNVGVGAETANLVLDDFCQAANTIQRRKDIGDVSIDKVAPEVIFEYLDGENDSSSTSVLGVGAILRAALGASGLAPQRLKRLAVLELRYAHNNIDHLEIDNSQMAFSKRIMHLPGRYIVKGMQGTSVVCTLQVELVVNKVTNVTC